jgi:hypothetical protein
MKICFCNVNVLPNDTALADLFTAADNKLALGVESMSSNTQKNGGKILRFVVSRNTQMNLLSHE